jgi:hypothetical protein
MVSAFRFEFCTSVFSLLSNPNREREVNVLRLHEMVLLWFVNVNVNLDRMGGSVDGEEHNGDDCTRDGIEIAFITGCGVKPDTNVAEAANKLAPIMIFCVCLILVPKFFFVNCFR